MFLAKLEKKRRNDLFFVLIRYFYYLCIVLDHWFNDITQKWQIN